jgi:molybdopterin/thiamine biosynthesis adenylyltransferase
MTAERYARHALIHWFSQDALRATRVAVIGAGAVGNEVVKNLALLGVAHIDVYDFDCIELSNLTRSVFFREADIGRSKAEVVAERARALDPNVMVRAVEGDFWSTLTLSALRQYQAAMLCVDNFEARIRLNQMCLVTGVSLVNTGIDSRYATVETFPFAADATAACYECHLPESAYRRMTERYSCGWLRKRAFEERKVPTTTITASACGALAASSALRLGQHVEGGRAKRILVDTITGRSTVTMLERAEACGGCSRFHERPRLVRSKRGLDLALMRSELARADDIAVVSSDPLITGYTCRQCGYQGDEARYVSRRAADFDDGITLCPRCNRHGVHVEIRDAFTLGELLTQFVGRPLPAKYVLATVGEATLCVELED